MDLNLMTNNLVNSFIYGIGLSLFTLLTFFMGYGVKNIINFLKKIVS